jgi:hypothetical protein
MFSVTHRPRMKELLQVFTRSMCAMGIAVTCKQCGEHFVIQPRGEDARTSQPWVQNVLCLLLSYAFQEEFVFNSEGVAKAVGPHDREKRPDDDCIVRMFKKWNI